MTAIIGSDVVGVFGGNTTSFTYLAPLVYCIIKHAAQVVTGTTVVDIQMSTNARKDLSFVGLSIVLDAFQMLLDDVHILAIHYHHLFSLECGSVGSQLTDPQPDLTDLR